MAALFTAPTPLDQLFLGQIYAFDPISLHLAARELGDEFEVPCVLAPEPAPVFKNLADIAVRGSAVTITIDTGRLSWAPELRSRRTVFDAYDGTQRRGVGFAHRPVARIDGNLVTRLPMRTADGEELSVWFRELDALDGYINAYDLLAHASETMGEWMEAPKLPRPIEVPAQQLTYQADVYGFGPITKQLFAAAMDETGARVIVRTVMMTGVLNFTEIPEAAVFGAQGPVLMWFSAPGSDQPFALIGTTADAWLDPEGEVDIDGLELPQIESASQTVAAFPSTVRHLHERLVGGDLDPGDNHDLTFASNALTQLMYLVGPMVDSEYLTRTLPPVAESGLSDVAAYITRAARNTEPGHLAELISSGQLLAIVDRASQR